MRAAGAREDAVLRERPLLIFDGDCGFCRRRVACLRRWTDGRVDFEPSQALAGEFPDIAPGVLAGSVVLVDTDGAQTRGAEAIFRVCALGGGAGRLPLALYHHLPGFAGASELGYRLVARHRVLASRLERGLRGDEPAAASFRAATWLFAKGLALVYLAAFLSLWPQIRGLVGEGGVAPLEPYLRSAAAVSEGAGLARWQVLPTFAWLRSDGAFLAAHCALGSALAGLLFLGLAPALMALLLALCYLSLVAAGGVFTNFQWDALLVETGFLAVWILPWRLRSRLASDPGAPGPARWLAWLLLVRLFFFSGAVKLASGGGDDNVWLDLSALAYHFETQPLPTPLGAWADALPLAVSRALCALMFAVELGAPWLVFLGRRARLAAAALLAALQVAIALTGNYGFFNLLTLVLCVLLLDDRALGALPGPRGTLARLREPARSAAPVRAARRLSLAGYAGLALVLSLFLWIHLAGRILERDAWRRLGSESLAPWQSLRLVNAYGLFARMTRTRNEITIQGSDDGELWLDYVLPYKPGPPERGLAWVAPHMPRLDWQLWFAALQGYQASPWFQGVLAGILRDSPDVLALFETNPFPGAPPRYVQARFVQYELTDPSTWRTSGARWKTSDIGPFITPMSLTPHEAEPASPGEER